MATTTLISVEEYLRTSYEPDAEYVNGVVEERAMGEQKHSLWQGVLVAFFWPRAKEWNIRVRPELRAKTGERSYRVPDVAILDADAPLDAVTIVPPLAAFEILSPEDRLSRLLVRLGNFEEMGVPALYVVDPADNSFFRYQAGKLSAVTEIYLRERVIDCSEIVSMLW